ncbi:hypothetical protein EMPS_08040 [Entomortierella parvispora]|uniref:O-fucosyltransferase family protein n=1 Tax=Entomortierella parvispora TaxID=205924 RepID=A0A9P3LZ14_9FUNG|nr:hypothetical protein EMPS_08040 [Entomortierella parvispora]
MSQISLARGLQRIKLAYILILASAFVVVRTILNLYHVDRDHFLKQQPEPLADHIPYKIQSEEQRHFFSHLAAPKQRPLPKWFVETQEFIRRMETNRPYPFFDRYLVYDVHMWLGLNNIRYGLEMTNNYGIVLNRTVIIPSKIFARNCIQHELCQLTGGKLVNLAESTDPIFSRWELDINTVWDVEEMRKTLNVMTTEEFNRVMLVQQGIVVEDPEAWIASQGGDLSFSRAFNVLKIYHDLDRKITVDSQLVLDFLFRNAPGVEIVDDLDPLPDKGLLPERPSEPSPTEAQEETKVVAIQPEITLWTVVSRTEMSMNETAQHTVPIRWRDTGYSGAAPVGFKQRFSSDAKVLHFQEGIHEFAAFPFKFTTAAARDRYVNVALHEMALNSQIREAQHYVLAKLLAMIGNKPYLGFHYRVGDFVQYSWSWNEPADIVIRRFIYASWIFRDRSNTTSDCEEIDLSTIHLRALPPGGQIDEVAEAATTEHMKRCMNRPFYFATDDSANLGFVQGLKSIGGIAMDDLLDREFVLKYPHITAFGDYQGLLDQWILANSEYFVGAAMSSLTGGALNMRRKIGKPGPTAVLMAELLNGRK